MEKLKKELEIVRGNMRVFGEMLSEITPGKGHQNDLELLQVIAGCMDYNSFANILCILKYY